MVASRLLAAASRQSVAAVAASAAVRRAGAARLGVAAVAAAEPFSGSFWLRVPHMLNQPSRYSTSIFQRLGFSSHVSNGETSSDKTAEEGMEDLDLSKDDLLKLLHEKDGLLKSKDDEIKDMKDKVLRSYAEIENVIARTKDVADNLARASSVVKESFSKIDTSKDSAGAVPLLQTLLEGVDMTDKQLAEVFKKFGVEKFDPLNEKFDPNRHCAVFQIPDPSKPSGTVASVVKVGYMLHDRVLRPAEVGVTEGGATEEAQQPEQKTAGD